MNKHWVAFLETSLSMQGSHCKVLAAFSPGFRIPEEIPSGKHRHLVTLKILILSSPHAATSQSPHSFPMHSLQVVGLYSVGETGYSVLPPPYLGSESPLAFCATDVIYVPSMCSKPHKIQSSLNSQYYFMFSDRFTFPSAHPFLQFCSTLLYNFPSP